MMLIFRQMPSGQQKCEVSNRVLFLFAYRPEFLAGFFGIEIDRVLNEQSDVVHALMQWRYVDRKCVQSVEKVLSDCASLDGTSQIAVCRRHHSYIYLERCSAPDAFEFPLLEHSQQGNLRLHGKLADLVEKDRTAARCFKAARAPLQSAGERAFLVPDAVPTRPLAKASR